MTYILFIKLIYLNFINKLLLAMVIYYYLYYKNFINLSIRLF